MSELTDEELSLWIATKLELKPSYEFIASRNFENAAAQMNLKCWRPEFLDYYDDHGHNKYKPVPRDFVNDPAMVLMLLAKIIDHDHGSLPDERYMETGFYYRRPLGRAVAETAAVMLGWKP